MARLFVYVPGLGESSDNVDELYGRLQDDPAFGPKDQTEIFKYRDAVHLLSRGGMEGRCRELARRIDSYLRERDVDDIVLIGHSAGGIMLRCAYLYALADDRLSQSWASRVSRIVLLAAPNRGLELKQITWWKRQIVRLFTALPFDLSGIDMLTGSPFISDLRIRWIREMTALGPRAPIAVQILGRADQLVEEDDSADISGFANGAQLALPHATHADCLRVSGVEEDREGERYDVLRSAVFGTAEELRSTPYAVPAPSDSAPSAVVFVLHGIRASNGDWPEDLKTMLGNVASAPNTGPPLVVTLSPGRISALRFTLPWARREHLRWFADAYTRYLVRHPTAPFHFVGHSNGTYIGGHSLKRIQSLRFDRVFLAGSVLPLEFDWQSYADDGRIQTLVNVCANKDKPVAWLCSALRGFGMRDIGTGGYAGFTSMPDAAIQVRWVEGDHGAALDTEDLPKVVDFLQGRGVDRSYTEVPTSNLFGVVSRGAPYLAWGALATLAGLGWLAVTTTGLVVGLLIVAVLLGAVGIGLNIA